MQLAKYTTGERPISEVTDQISTLQTQLETLDKYAINPLAGLDIVTNTALPQYVQLSGAIPQGSGFVLAGFANNYLNAYNYITN